MIKTVAPPDPARPGDLAGSHDERPGLEDLAGFEGLRREMTARRQAEKHRNQAIANHPAVMKARANLKAFLAPHYALPAKTAASLERKVRAAGDDPADVAWKVHMNPGRSPGGWHGDKDTTALRVHIPDHVKLAEYLAALVGAFATAEARVAETGETRHGR